MNATRSTINANTIIVGIALGVLIAPLVYGAGWVAVVSYGVHQQAAQKTQQQADVPRCVDVYGERARKAYALPACKVVAS